MFGRMVKLCHPFIHGTGQYTRLPTLSCQLRMRQLGGGRYFIATNFDLFSREGGLEYAVSVDFNAWFLSDGTAIFISIEGTFPLIYLGVQVWFISWTLHCRVHDLYRFKMPASRRLALSIILQFSSLCINFYLTRSFLPVQLNSIR